MTISTAKKILVIEDDPSAAQLAQVTLEGAGYRVIVCPDGEMGVDIATSESTVDLVVLDIMLPGMSGFDVNRRLLSNPRTATLPVLILTAAPDNQDRIAEFVLTEPGAYLAKPADPDAFLETVEHLLERDT